MEPQLFLIPYSQLWIESQSMLWFDAYSFKTTRTVDVEAYARHPPIVSVARELGYEALDMDEREMRQRYAHAPP